MKSKRKNEGVRWNLAKVKEEPLLDWDRLRVLKCRFCENCDSFSHLLGGCSLWLMPDERCPHRPRGGDR